MANTHSTLSALFVDIANAIRAKKNSTEAIIADNFPAEIEGLKTGFDYNNQNATTISDYEFYGCTDLNNVDCYNLTNVGTSAFEGCSNLKTVILYDGVESVGENAFKGCDNVIIYSKAFGQPETWHENWNPDNRPVLWYWHVEELVGTWDISATSEDNVTAKLYNDINNEGYYSLVISGSGNMKNYSSSSFVPWYNYRSNIKSINIPDSVTSIGNSAFYSCESLTSITIPNSVTSIGGSAFSCCDSLTSITIPNSVTSIGHYAFNGCSNLTSITVPDSVTDIDDSVFSVCTSLTSINIPDSVTSIGNYAFYNCKSLTSITYTGTIAQWNAITFGYAWNSNTSNYTIHCTDGDIAKS